MMHAPPMMPGMPLAPITPIAPITPSIPITPITQWGVDLAAASGVDLNWPVMLTGLALAMPRFLAAFALLPMFTAQQLPGMLRFAVAGALALFVVPVVLGGSPVGGVAPGLLILLILKEAFLGVVLGFLFAIPFWAFEAVGFLIDNQRGAGMGAMLNPESGQDSSPLGMLFAQAFIILFLASGGLFVLLDVIYDSFLQWDVWQWRPLLSVDAATLALAHMDRLVRLAFLLSAPVILAMFLAEWSLALVSRYVPQLQVFFLAMPIKSALAIWILILFASALAVHGETLVLESGLGWELWR